MPVSVYGEILTRMLAKLPDALSAVFADWEGEAVDSAGIGTQSGIRLIGAHWGVIYYLVRDAFLRGHHEAPSVLTLRFSERLFIVQHITDHYYVVLESRIQAKIAWTLHVLNQMREQLLEQI